MIMNYVAMIFFELIFTLTRGFSFLLFFFGVLLAEILLYIYFLKVVYIIIDEKDVANLGVVI